MPQYKFITVEGGDGQPSKLTRSIRSHAIRAGLQNTTCTPSAKAAVTSLRTTKYRGDLMFCFELHGDIKTQRDRSKSNIVSVNPTALEYKTPNAHSLPNTSGETQILPPTYRVESLFAASFDPFNSLPIPTNPAVDYLVRYFLIKFGFNFDTADRRTSWFLYALQSVPTMHSTLAMAAAFWRAECPTLECSIQLEGIRQKGEAMQEVMTQITHARSAGNNDDVNLLMFTMSTLVIAEVCDNNFEAAETHLKGIYTLFSSRGGHDRFEGDFVLCKAINLADFQVASALEHEPIFPLMHIDQVDLPASFLNHAQNPPLDQSVIQNSSDDVVHIFAQLRQLLLARQSTVVPLDALRMMLNVVDDSILRYLYQDQSGVSDPSRRSRTLVLAAHVLMYVALRQMPPKGPLLRRMCTRLQFTIGLTPSAIEKWSENRAALLWIAFVGLLGTGECTETCPEGKWFLNLFQTTAQAYPQYSISGNGSIHETLSAFLWDEPCCQPLLVRLELRLRGSQ